MKKSDLKSGMIVQTRYGSRYMVLKDCETEGYGHQEVIFVSPRGFLIGDEFDENLQMKSGYRIFDIVYCSSDKVGGNFFKDVERKLQEFHPLSDDVRNFTLGDKEYNLLLIASAVEDSGNLVKFEFFIKGELVHSMVNHWRSRKYVEKLFGEWKLSLRGFNKAKLIEEYEDNNRLTKNELALKILKNAFGLSDETHSQILNIITKNQSIDEVDYEELPHLYGNLAKNFRK